MLIFWFSYYVCQLFPRVQNKELVPHFYVDFIDIPGYSKSCSSLLFNSKTLQTCVLSKYANYECSFQQNAFLKDIQYWIGFKKDGKKYAKYYHYYVIVLLSLYIITYLKSHILKKEQ